MDRKRDRKRSSLDEEEACSANKVLKTVDTIKEEVPNFGSPSIESQINPKKFLLVASSVDYEMLKKAGFSLVPIEQSQDTDSDNGAQQFQANLPVSEEKEGEKSSDSLGAEMNLVTEIMSPKSKHLEDQAINANGQQHDTDNQNNEVVNQAVDDINQAVEDVNQAEEAVNQAEEAVNQAEEAVNQAVEVASPDGEGAILHKDTINAYIDNTSEDESDLFVSGPSDYSSDEDISMKVSGLSKRISNYTPVEKFEAIKKSKQLKRIKFPSKYAISKTNTEKDVFEENETTKLVQTDLSGEFALEPGTRRSCYQLEKFYLRTLEKIRKCAAENVRWDRRTRMLLQDD